MTGGWEDVPRERPAIQGTLRQLESWLNDLLSAWEHDFTRMYGVHEYQHYTDSDRAQLRAKIDELRSFLGLGSLHRPDEYGKEE